MLQIYKYILIIAIVISSPIAWATDFTASSSEDINKYGNILDFSECIQEQDQWCWAATTQCVLKY
ncbi:MAG: hypothetical protein PVI54_15665, partial [Desulfobacteraceae bacterium]